MIKRQLKTLLFLAFAAVAWQGASAQHTLGFTAGYGMASSRLDPKQEMKAIWGSYTAGLTWRYYGQQLFVGGFGIDSNSCSRDSSLATNALDGRGEEGLRYYTRNVNSIVLPIVWQPHFYLFRNHVRVYLEAAATSPITSLRPMRTRGRKLRERPTGRATTPSNCRATTVGATDLRAAAVSRC